MAITVLTDGSTANNTRTLTWTIPTLVTGDIIVIGGMTWDPGDAQLNNPSGTGLAFGSPRVVRTTAAKVYQAMWAMAATAGGTNVVVTCSQTTGTNNMHTGVLWVLPTADGYSLATTPNTASVLTSGGGQLPQGTLSGASGNLGFGMIGDWNGTTLAGRAYAGSATEDLASINDSTQIYFHQTLTGSSNTVGLSSPTIATASWDVMAIEVLKSAGGTPGTFTANAGDAPAAGGSVTFTGAATFTANAGDGPAAGGSVTMTGGAVFSVTAGDAPADGGSVTMTGAAVFSANAGDAPADGGSVTFSAGGTPGTFTANAGDAPADGGSVTFTGAAVFAVNAGDAPANGGSVTFVGSSASTFTVLAGDATADGGSVSFTAPGTFTAAAGDAPAAGGSASFTVAATFTVVAGDAPASGGSVTMTGAALFATAAGDATAAGGTAFFIAGEIPVLPTRGVSITITATVRGLNVTAPVRGLDIDAPTRRLEVE